MREMRPQIGLNLVELGQVKRDMASRSNPLAPVRFGGPKLHRCFGGDGRLSHPTEIAADNLRRRMRCSRPTS